MKGLFHTDSTLYRILSFIADLVMLNLLALICSIPIVTIGAVSTALIYSTEKLGKGDGALVTSFFHSFKQNFRQSTLLWVLLLLCAAAIGFCIVFCRLLGNVPILIVAIVALVIWGAVSSWVFPLAAKFYFPTKSAFRNAALCAIAYWPVSLVMIATNFLPFALLLYLPEAFFRVGFLWLLLWFSAAAFCNQQLLRQPFATLAEQSHFD